jgi:hypothetical protein
LADQFAEFETFSVGSQAKSTFTNFSWLVWTPARVVYAEPGRYPGGP